MRNKAVVVFLIYSILFFTFPKVEAAAIKAAIATNQSTSTLCAEDDNINVPFNGNIVTFTVEATHPTYTVGTDNCAADFTNCQPAASGYSYTPGVFKLYDDGESVVEAVRESSWWRPTGMTFSVDNGNKVTDIHYVRIYRKIADANEWPQFLVLYMDGNMRLIPQPPVGASNVCFGSSVIIGPTTGTARPIAEITSAIYNSSSKTIETTYKIGGSAILSIDDVNRTLSRVNVAINYPTNTNPFAVFRSMYVSDGNADVDHVKWNDISTSIHNEPIMIFSGGEGVEWFYHRSTHSKHNTSAPDIRIRMNSNNCAATLLSDLKAHVPIGIYNGQSYSADFQWDGGDGVILTNLTLLNETSAFSNCTPSTVSSALILDIPEIIYYGVSYWVDVQCNTEGAPFKIIGVGQN